MARLVCACVKVAIVFRQYVDVVEYETVEIVDLFGLRETDVHHHRFVEHRWRQLQEIETIILICLLKLMCYINIEQHQIFLSVSTR